MSDHVINKHVEREFFYHIYKGGLFIAIFILFGPFSFYMDRFSESIAGILLALICIVFGLLSSGWKKDNNKWVAFTFVAIPTVLFVDLLIHQSIYNGFVFLFPFLEVSIFILALSFWSSTYSELWKILSIAILFKSVLIIYTYSVGGFYNMSLEFSENSSIIEIGGIVLQRPMDAGVSLYAVVCLWLAIKGLNVKLNVITLILTIVVSVLSFSRSLWLSVLIAILFLVIFEKKLKYFAIYLIVILFVVSSYAIYDTRAVDFVENLIMKRVEKTETQMDTKLGMLRIYEIRDALTRWADGNVMLGIGPSGSIHTYKRHGGDLVITEKQYIHNYHVLLLVKLGIIGFLIILGFIAYVFLYRRDAILFYLLSVLIFLSFQPVVLTSHLLAMVGILFAIRNGNDKQIERNSSELQYKSTNVSLY